MSRVFCINENIKESVIKLVLEDGKMYGNVLLETALEMADEKGLDLVEVSPSHDGQLSICKLLNYGKLLYKKISIRKKIKKLQKK